MIMSTHIAIHNIHVCIQVFVTYSDNNVFSQECMNDGIRSSIRSCMLTPLHVLLSSCNGLNHGIWSQNEWLNESENMVLAGF